MSRSDRVLYVNGRFVAAQEAHVPVMDRGFLFADGVYEISAVVAGRLLDNSAHLARLARSLRALDIPNPHARQDWVRLQEALIEKNGLQEGLVYIQVTRGVAERDFLYPDNLVPTVVMFTQPGDVVHAPKYASGIHVISVPDQRWARRDIKSMMLLAQVLAKREAVQRGAHDAWLIENGTVSEGASSSAYIVTQDGVIVTRPLSHAILAGITRASIVQLCQEQGLKLAQRAFTLTEAYAASEAFVTAAGSIAAPVVKIDDRPIGNGRPGPLAERLRQLYFEAAGVVVPVVTRP